MTPKEKLFLDMYSELKERFNQADGYNILKGSGLVRQLLVDENSIIDQVNRAYRIKILYKVQRRFSILTERIQEDGTVWKAMYGMTFLSPKDDSESYELLKKDDFFKYEVLFHYEKRFTVLDVIKICANKYGGVHYDEKLSEKEDELNSTHLGLILNDDSSVYHSMHTVMKICIDALFPLYMEIHSKYSLDI